MDDPDTPKTPYPAAKLIVEKMMNTNFEVLHPEDTLKVVITYYQKYKISTLPVVDEKEKLIGVFPKKRLYKALLEGAGLDTPCRPYMVENPVFITVDRTYDEYSLVAQVTKSKVDNVVVLGRSGKVVGMVGTAEYLRESLQVIRELDIARKWDYLNKQVEDYRGQVDKWGMSGKRFDQIITINSAFKKIKKEASLIARSSSTVLLTGESGVGKDMFARGIHEASPRARHPFIKVNCVSIPETLFESELFGYAPGSFTGALKSGKQGYFERADKGTIFLDEIGDIPLPIQAKLLQVLQEKEFVRVGGTGKQVVDVRIIAATNRDLREAVERRAFREDLFYRLNVIEFHLLPLRARPEDILPLAESFVVKYNHILGSKVSGISDSARKALQEYGWPGNVRELENAIERAANFIWEGEIGVEELPGQIVQSKAKLQADAASFHSSLADFEKEKLLEVLEKAGGNKSAAARLLGLSRSAFYDKLTKYDLR